MRVTFQPVAIWVVFLTTAFLTGVPAKPQSVTVAQPATDNLHLNPRIGEHAYQDDKINLEAPADWKLSMLVVKTAVGGVYQGVELSKGKYQLRLCTGCRQAIGVFGGGFSEVAPLIQPQYRADFVTLPIPCGEMQRTVVSKELERQDFWFRRDPAHRYNEAENDCREPTTIDTVWYGSYFGERCSESDKVRNCGGYFLHHDHLTKHRPEVDDEMVFVFIYDTADVNQLPHQNDPQLQEMLKEASAIVRSIKFIKAPK